MADNVMRGAHPIRKQFASFLSVMVPVYVQYATNEWTEISELGIQLPKNYDGEDPYEVTHDQYPMIGITPQRATGYERIDFDTDGGNEYQSQWVCQLFVATKTRVAMDVDDEGFTLSEQPARPSVISARDDLAGIVMNVLLAYPDLAIDNSDSVITVDENSLQLDMIPPMRTNDPNVWVAVAQIGLSLRMREVAWVPPLSVVQKFVPDIKKISN